MPKAPWGAAWVLLGAARFALSATPETALDPPSLREEDFLTRVRQLTFDGRRAGEGYFSTDGGHLVFQSEREPENPFFQIYEMDLGTGDTRRVSPGTGKTTCAFFRPGSGVILYASTHHDPRSRDQQREEFERRASGAERRYEWDFDPEMELYVSGPQSGDTRRLTAARGYDAEASYSPDGRLIVFTSNRQAFERERSAEQQRQFETDPSYFAEIYRMNADGTDVRRLTAVPGYDGGPFFSPDGKAIYWRRFRPDGLIADIFRMEADGSSPSQVTDFGCMSWAPYPHPSGEYLIFTSNKQGFENFELYLVDVGGTREPVRVTYTAGFDGLPVPSPDGRRLAWTSSRRGDKGQILLADWNHERAIAALRSAPPRKPMTEHETR